MTALICRQTFLHLLKSNFFLSRKPLIFVVSDYIFFEGVCAKKARRFAFARDFCFVFKNDPFFATGSDKHVSHCLLIFMMCAFEKCFKILSFSHLPKDPQDDDVFRHEMLM